MTFGLTADPSFQQVMAAVPPPVGRTRGRLPTRHRCYHDLADAAASPRYGGAAKAREAGHGIEDIAEHAQHTDVNTTREHYIVPSTEASRAVAKQRTSAGEKGNRNEGKMESLT